MQKTPDLKASAGVKDVCWLRAAVQCGLRGAGAGEAWLPTLRAAHQGGQNGTVQLRLPQLQLPQLLLQAKHPTLNAKQRWLLWRFVFALLPQDADGFCLETLKPEQDLQLLQCPGAVILAAWDWLNVTCVKLGISA